MLTTSYRGGLDYKIINHMLSAPVKVYFYNMHVLWIRLNSLLPTGAVESSYINLFKNSVIDTCWTQNVL